MMTAPAVLENDRPLPKQITRLVFLQREEGGASYSVYDILEFEVPAEEAVHYFRAYWNSKFPGRYVGRPYRIERGYRCAAGLVWMTQPPRLGPSPRPSVFPPFPK